MNISNVAYFENIYILFFKNFRVLKRTFIKRLFSQTLLLLEGEKANCHFYYVEIAYYF